VDSVKPQLKAGDYARANNVSSFLEVTSILSRLLTFLVELTADELELIGLMVEVLPHLALGL
jgi:hypothetical protein